MRRRIWHRFKVSLYLLVLIAAMGWAIVLLSMPAIIAPHWNPDTDIYLTRSDAYGNELWSKTFGGSGDQYGSSVKQTIDGGFIIVGTGWSDNSNYVCLIKTRPSGNQQWIRKFKYSETIWGNAIQQTSDMGFIISGAVDTDPGCGVFLIKTDNSGNQQWMQIYADYGGSNIGSSVQQTTDGGYIIAGSKYMTKTDSVGDYQWTTTLGEEITIVAIEQTSDSGFIVLGRYGCFVYLIKTDELGKQLWSVQLSGMSSEPGASVHQTSDDGFIVLGHGCSSYRYTYLVKTDEQGNQEWKYTSQSSDSGYSVQQTSDGSFVITGSTYSFDDDGDALLIKIDAFGNELWRRILGGPSYHGSVEQTSDDGLIIVGSVNTYKWAKFSGWPLTALSCVMVILGARWLIRRKREELKQQITELKSQMEQWRSEGYDVSSLEDLFR